ncbi:MAG: hypothetical protein Q7S53_05650 [bacterium]|nr:hypothetical protein [bacterium]
MSNAFRKIIEFIEAKKILVIVCALALVIIVIATTVVLIKRSPEKKSEEFRDVPKIAETRVDESASQWPSTSAKYITAVPVDLSQIQSISKYRSCAGHDFAGYSFEQVQEANRSMKHYVYPTPQFQGTTDKVKVFAPFDGVVSKVELESEVAGQPGKRPKTGNSITFSTEVDKNVGFEFSHVYFAGDFKVGDKVKAGELIGYAALGDKGNDFDLVLSGTRLKNEKAYGSAFDHMTDSVLAEFAKYGVTPENNKFTKEYRDANPCDFTQQQQRGRTGADWLQLKH